MTNARAHDREITEYLSGLAFRAGAKALDIYRSDFAADEKCDASPVTDADRLGEEIILAGLAKCFPQIPALAEERASEGEIPALGDEFFLVDPLDGTREFIDRTGEFTVNIALARNGRPVLGVVYAPAAGKLYAGATGEGAWMHEVDDSALGPARPIRAREVLNAHPVAVASRSHRSAETDAWLDEIGAKDFAAAGSSLKFCLIAEGKADVYPRFGRTMEWDTAAGQAVLEAAGGAVLTRAEGISLSYGKRDRGFANPHFIAWGVRPAPSSPLASPGSARLARRSEAKPGQR